MQDQSSTASFCPSFSSYSQNNQNNYPHISTVAARVSDEEKRRNDEEENDFEFVVLPRASISRAEDKEEEEEEESRVALPLFDLDLVSKEYSFADVAPPPPPRFSPSRLVSLEKLFVEDRKGEDPPSSSSSEAGEEYEVDGASPGTYCIWKPNLPPARCKKSNSTGSSSAAEKPKWRLRNLLRRSSSDGKNSNYIFLNPPLPPPINNNKAEGRSKTASSPLHISKAKGKGQASAHEALYVRNKAMREEDKRRSYLPYRRDLVGLLTFPHF